MFFTDTSINEEKQPPPRCGPSRAGHCSSYTYVILCDYVHTSYYIYTHIHTYTYLYLSLYIYIYTYIHIHTSLLYNIIITIYIYTHTHHYHYYVILHVDGSDCLTQAGSHVQGMKFPYIQATPQEIRPEYSWPARFG